MKPEPERSLFTLNEKPILAIGLAGREKFTYITNPKDHPKPEPESDIFSSMLSIPELFRMVLLSRSSKKSNQTSWSNYLKNPEKYLMKELST